jgi:hypothetical protein
MYMYVYIYTYKYIYIYEFIYVYKMIGEMMEEREEKGGREIVMAEDLNRILWIGIRGGTFQGTIIEIKILEETKILEEMIIETEEMIMTEVIGDLMVGVERGVGMVKEVEKEVVKEIE